MKKVYLSSILFSSLVVLAACGGESNEAGDNNGIEQQEIIITHDVTDTHIKNQASEVLKEFLESESDGKIEVKIFGNNTLFDTANQYQNLASNNTQFIISDMSRMVDIDPAFNIPSLPFLFSDNEASMEFWNGESGQEILKSFEKDGVMGMAVWPNGEKHIMNNNVAIQEPGDVNGLKLRVQGGPLLNETYGAMNANSQSLAIDELYTSLETGVVDGLENTLGTLESFNFDEVTDYLTLTGHNRIDYVLQTNVDFWESLNEETQDLIKEGIQKATDYAVETSDSLNQEALEELKNRGNVEIIELTDSEIENFRETLAPLYEKWVPIIGEAYIEEINNNRS